MADGGGERNGLGAAETGSCEVVALDPIRGLKVDAPLAARISRANIMYERRNTLVALKFRRAELQALSPVALNVFWRYNRSL